jgi:hypothetical protein
MELSRNCQNDVADRLAFLHPTMSVVGLRQLLPALRPGYVSAGVTTATQSADYRNHCTTRGAEVTVRTDANPGLDFQVANTASSGKPAAVRDARRD